MKYNEKIISVQEFNESVTGEKKIYPCKHFTYNNLEKVSQCEDVICLTSNITINGERKYLTIDFYNDIQEFKDKLYKNNSFSHVFVIPNVKNEVVQIDIISDIKKKHF